MFTYSNQRSEVLFVQEAPDVFGPKRFRAQTVSGSFEKRSPGTVRSRGKLTNHETTAPPNQFFTSRILTKFLMNMNWELASHTHGWSWKIPRWNCRLVLFVAVVISLSRTTILLIELTACNFFFGFLIGSTNKGLSSFFLHSSCNATASRESHWNVFFS